MRTVATSFDGMQFDPRDLPLNEGGLVFVPYLLVLLGLFDSIREARSFVEARHVG
jgi:hypothetical protein